jgi:hypothetical protein
MCALVLGSAAVLFTPSGIAGAGWAVLLSMTLIAVVSMAGLRAALRQDDSVPAARPPAAPSYGTHWAKLNATAGYGTTWARRAAYQPKEGDQDTVTLFIGRPGYEREALQADTLALIVRPEGPTGQPPPHDPGEPDQEPRERRLRGALWSLLGVAVVFFWAPLRDLPWLDRASEASLTGRQLLEGLPLPSLTAGGLLLVVFVAAVTLSTRRDPWLPGTALGAALIALYAAPAALGREPRPVDGALYEKTAGFLADAVGLSGPEPLLRWAPPVCQLLCLVPLGLLLASAGGRLPWPGRWGVLYLVAVGGWVWRDALAPVAPPLLVALTLLLLLHRAVTAWARTRTTASTGPLADRTADEPPSGPPRD